MFTGANGAVTGPHSSCGSRWTSFVDGTDVAALLDGFRERERIVGARVFANPLFALTFCGFPPVEGVVTPAQLQ